MAGPDPSYSDRGFAYWRPTAGTYGDEIDVHESSAAAAPHLWVSIEGACHLNGPARDHPGVSHGIAHGSASVHLTMEAARDLAAKLQAAIVHSERRFEAGE